MFELINARLPLISDMKYFSLKVSDGKIVDLKEQYSYIYDGNAYPIDREFPINSQNEIKLNVNGRAVLPGLVDSHMHMDKAFSLAFAPNQSGTLQEAVNSYLTAFPNFTYENIKNRIMRTALQALSFGTTVIRTHIDFDTRVDIKIMFRALQAALEVKERLKDYIHIQIVLMCPFYELNQKDLEFLDMAAAMGVDGIGGASHLGKAPEENIKQIFQIAIKHNKFIDLHTDESDDPNVKTIKLIIQETGKNGYQGKVTVGHLCSLSAMNEREASEIIEDIGKAKISVITLPAANMYLQGRGDRGLVRRGVTRIRELSDAGVQIAVASDNINDPFHPFGRGDLVMIGLLAGYAAHFGSPEDLYKLLLMMTAIPANIVGMESYGIKEGHNASFVILDANSIEQIFTNIPDKRWVYHNNHWTIRTDGKPVFQNKELNVLWHTVDIKL